MKGSRAYWLAAMMTCVFLLAGCGSGGGESGSTNPTSTDKLIGTWAFDGNTSNWPGAEKSTGHTGTLTVKSDQTFTIISYSPVGSVEFNSSGTWSSSGTSNSFMMPTGPMQMATTFSNNDNTISLKYNNSGGLQTDVYQRK